MHCGPNEPTLFDFGNNSTRQFIHSLVAFQKAYAPIHGRICVFLCLFGVLTNLIHCVVLTRPQMRQSAVNTIMTAVALCDLGTMGSYLVYIWHFVLVDHSCSNAQTQVWMWFLLLHIFLSILLHTATLWLAVLMAFLRRMTLHRTTLYSNWQRVSLARRASLGVVFTVLLLCIPSLAVHEVIEYSHARWQPADGCFPDKEEEEGIPSSSSFASFANQTTEPLFTVVIRQSSLANGCLLFKANLWLTGICFKVIPCLLLLVLSASLLQKLRQAERKRCLLLISQIGIGPQQQQQRGTAGGGGELTGASTPVGNGGGQQQQQNNMLMMGSTATTTTAAAVNAIGAAGGGAGLKKIHSDRTTALLLTILCVFILMELPQGMIAILNAIYTADVHRFIYLTLGDVLDLLSILNSSVNFVLYCLMSSRYRQTFCSLFMPIKVCKRCVDQAKSIPMPSFASVNQALLFRVHNNNNINNQPEREQMMAEEAGTTAGGRSEVGGLDRQLQIFRQNPARLRRRSTPIYRWLGGITTTGNGNEGQWQRHQQQQPMTARSGQQQQQQQQSPSAAAAGVVTTTHRLSMQISSQHQQQQQLLNPNTGF